MATSRKSFRKFKKIPILVALIFFTFSALSFFYILSTIEENRVVANNTKAEWQKIVAERAELLILNRLLKEKATDIQKVDEHFAQSSNVVPFLDSIEELARSVNAKPEVVSIDPAPEQDGVWVVVNTTGSFEANFKFLELLENFPYELEFGTVDLARSGAGEWGGFFKIKLLTYIP